MFNETLEQLNCTRNWEEEYQLSVEFNTTHKQNKKTQELKRKASLKGNLFPGNFCRFKRTKIQFKETAIEKLIIRQCYQVIVLRW